MTRNHYEDGLVYMKGPKALTGPKPLNLCVFAFLCWIIGAQHCCHAEKHCHTVKILFTSLLRLHLHDHFRKIQQRCFVQLFSGNTKLQIKYVQ